MKIWNLSSRGEGNGRCVWWWKESNGRSSFVIRYSMLENGIRPAHPIPLQSGMEKGQDAAGRIAEGEAL